MQCNINNNNPLPIYRSILLSLHEMQKSKTSLMGNYRQKSVQVIEINDHFMQFFYGWNFV